MKKTNQEGQQHSSKPSQALSTLKDVVSGLMHNKEFLSSKDLKEERLKICEKCPHYKKKRCQVCGCFMGVKASLKEARCPKGFWAEKMVEKVMFGEYSEQYNERDCCNGQF